MKLCKGAVLALAVSYGLIYCHTNKSKFMLEQKGDSLTLIHITNPTNCFRSKRQRKKAGFVWT